MKKLTDHLKKHLNLNSYLVMVLIALLKWEGSRLYSKLDAMEAAQLDLVQRVSRLEGAAGLTSIPPKPIK